MPSGPEDHPRAGVKNLIKEHASVFNIEEKLRTMKGGPMKIKLKDGTIKPIHVNTPRKTPYAFQNAAKSKLDHLVKLGVLELVEDVSD